MNVARRTLGLLALVVALLAVSAPPVSAVPETDAFRTAWTYVDAPVAENAVSRTWLWGPVPFTKLLREPYADAPDGWRYTQYFDKGRMEITSPDGGFSSVTSGLLARELVSGRMQVGDDTFETRQPASIGAVGDLDDPNAPTYATFSGLVESPALAEGVPVTQTVTRDGAPGDDPALARYGVTAAHRVSLDGLDHTVASVFWAYLQSNGLVQEDGQRIEARLFPNPFEVVGYPVTEAWWTKARVNGVERDVLAQVFERRVLTWTPDNPPGWQVEMGNAGQHYYLWRYGDLPFWRPIVFTSDRDGNVELYLTDPYGTHLTRLTDTPENEQYPRWSPDRQRLTFQRVVTEGSSNLYVMNADGSGEVMLTPEAADWSGALWSPDGEHLAFTGIFGTPDTPTWGLFTVRPDGTELTRLTDEYLQVGFSGWSPDGIQLLFSGNQCQAGPSLVCESDWHSYVMNADGSGLMKLSDLDGGYSLWSPDGSRIAGVGRVCNEPNPADCREPWQVYTVLADGSDLTFLAEDGYALTWSPDGTRLAFARGEDMDDLVVMNADGTDQAVIATVRGISSIAWSPDGERLAIMAQPGPYQIFVINADGSSILELASHDPNRFEVFPVWSPDGGSIAFTTLDGNDSELRVVNAEGWGEINLSGYSGVDGNPDW